MESIPDLTAFNDWISLIQAAPIPFILWLLWAKILPYWKQTIIAQEAANQRDAETVAVLEKVAIELAENRKLTKAVIAAFKEGGHALTINLE